MIWIKRTLLILILILVLSTGAVNVKADSTPALEDGAVEVIVTKYPSPEQTTAGGTAWFTAGAEYAVKTTWRIWLPGGNSGLFNAEEAPFYYPGVVVTGQGTDSLCLQNIPHSMNGCLVECMYTGNDNRQYFTAWALLTVSTPAPVATRLPVTTPAPTETEQIPVTESVPAVSGPHVHVYSDEWTWYELSHWHECSCGAHGDEEFHDFVWAVSKEPTVSEEGEQFGVCRVCGYGTVQPIPKIPVSDRSGKSSTPAVIAFFILLSGSAGFLICRKKH